MEGRGRKEGRKEAMMVTVGGRKEGEKVEARKEEVG